MESKNTHIDKLKSLRNQNLENNVVIDYIPKSRQGGGGVPPTDILEKHPLNKIDEVKAKGGIVSEIMAISNNIPKVMPITANRMIEQVLDNIVGAADYREPGVSPMDDVDTNRELIATQRDSGIAIAGSIIKIPDNGKKTKLIFKKDTQEVVDKDCVKCRNVTTEYLDNSKSFSYLTNPVSKKDRIYFIIKDHDYEFILPEKFQTGDLKNVSTKMLDEFVTALNAQSNLLKALEKIRLSNIVKRSILLMVSYIFILIGTVLFFQLRPTSDSPSDGIGTIGSLAVSFAVIGVGVLLVILISFVIFKHTRKDETMFFVKRYDGYKLTVDKWNSEYFLHQGVKCTTVRNLNYFQILPVDLEVLVEPHSRMSEKGANTAAVDAKSQVLLEPESGTEYTYGSLEEFNLVYM
jgi:hypothetical protein